MNNQFMKNSLSKAGFGGLLKSIIFIFLVLGSDLMAQVKVYEEKMNLPTYQVDPPSKVPQFFNNQSTQGAANYIYPLAINRRGDGS